MRRLYLVAALVVFLAIPASAAGVSPQQMLHRGVTSLEAGDANTAARRLRIAAFGLIGDAPAYANALVHLTVALHRSGDAAGAEKVVVKLVEVERVARVLHSLDVPPTVHAEFSTVARKVISNAPARSAGLSAFLDKYDTRRNDPAPLHAGAGSSN